MNTINTREDRYHLLGRRFKGWGIEYLWGEAQGLGLRKIHQTVEVLDTPCNRGMVTKAAYLLQVEEA